MGDSNCFFARCDRHWNIHTHARARKKIVCAPVLELACGGVMLQDRTTRLLKDWSAEVAVVNQDGVTNMSGIAGTNSGMNCTNKGAPLF